MTQESAFPVFVFVFVFCFALFLFLFLFILQNVKDMLPVKHNIVTYGQVSFMVWKTSKMELIQNRRCTIVIYEDQSYKFHWYPSTSIGYRTQVTKEQVGNNRCLLVFLHEYSGQSPRHYPRTFDLTTSAEKLLGKGWHWFRSFVIFVLYLTCTMSHSDAILQSKFSLNNIFCCLVRLT